MDIETLISQMTLKEKADMCSGKDFWHTQDIERLDLPSVMMCDGPHGLRKQAGAGDHLGINESIPAVCFPSACALASSFDETLAEKIGQTAGRECLVEEIAMLLGPGINMKRSPLCGRNFEYFSEDPLLAGKIAAAMVRGIQSSGTVSCIKHFAANNQETLRMSSNSVVDERTLHEIYLAAFETVIKEAKPGAVMCSYNQVNGTFMSENKELLTDVLRSQWGFDGFVVTDWGAVQNIVKGIQAGLDLTMPGGNSSYSKAIIDAVNNGSLSEQDLDQTVRRLLKFIQKTSSRQNTGGISPVFDYEGDYKTARDAAAECAVLLKNDNHILPISHTAKTAFIGEFAAFPRYQGSGSSHINSAKTVSALHAADSSNILYAKGYDTKEESQNELLLAEALKTASLCDCAVIFAGLPDAFESEGMDRDTLELPSAQNRLIEEICKVQPNTIVVLHNGAPVTMPWIQHVPAVLEMYLAGDGAGEAAVSLLYGDINPSGKLAETFPVKLSDNPSYLNFPGEHGNVEYREGIFIGYRYYDKKESDVLFPFGHGLSYTTFRYSDLSVDQSDITDQDTLKITAIITNTGSHFGKEAVQLYVRDTDSTYIRPVRELKAFKKIALNPGESKKITFTLDSRAFSFYSTQTHNFTVETGEFLIELGASSRDIRLSVPVTVTSTGEPQITFTRNSTMGELMKFPKAQSVLQSLMTGRAQSSASDMDALGEGGRKMAENMMQEMPLSGLVTFGGMSEEQLEEILQMLNC